MGPSPSQDLENNVDILDRINQGERGTRLTAIKNKATQFNSKELKNQIISWMHEALSSDCSNTINFLRKKTFDETFLKLLENLPSILYGTIINSIVWILESKPISLEDPSIRKKVLQLFLGTAFDDQKRKGSFSQITIFREFIDCWVSIDCNTILDYIIYFTMDIEDSPFFDNAEIYRERDVKLLQKETREVLTSVLSKNQGQVKKIYNIVYKKDCKYRLFNTATSNQVKKLSFFLSQVAEEAKTISEFLFQLFWYIFNFIDLPKNTDDSRVFSDQDHMKEVITRYMFSKDSTLLTLSLYLVRVLHSEAHNHFIEKKEALDRTEDQALLNKKIMRELRQQERVTIEFKEELSKIRKELRDNLVKQLEHPCVTFDDILDRLKLFASQLEDLPNQDHYYLVYWAEILTEWMAKTFDSQLELDMKIEMLHVIIKYITSKEVLVFAIAIEILHRERLEHHQFFHLLILTMQTPWEPSRGELTLAEPKPSNASEATRDTESLCA